MKHATNGEVLLFKRPIEQKFSVLFSNMDGPNEEEVVDFEFISNPQVLNREAFSKVASFEILIKISGHSEQRQVHLRIRPQPPLQRQQQ